MTLAEYIKDYRARMGYSQRRFASRCDISNAYLSILENGVNPSTGGPVTPSIETLGKIAYGMGITVHQLMSEIDDCKVTISPEVVERRENEDYLRSLSEDERILFRLAKGSKPEAIRAAVAVLKSFKDTNTDF